MSVVAQCHTRSARGCDNVGGHRGNPQEARIVGNMQLGARGIILPAVAILPVGDGGRETVSRTPPKTVGSVSSAIRMTLPFLLAGPILRRVDPTSVSVWVAVSEASQIELQLFDGLKTDLGSSPLFSGGLPAFHATTPTLRIGANLHIAVVTVTRPESTPFLAGALFSYLVLFHRSGGDDDLKSLSLLGQAGASSGFPLGYAPGALPSFATAPNFVEQLVILHGSCRKPHGLGRDGLAFADSIIGESRTSATKRPHQLFLTGDQIYADDVAAALLWELIHLGHELLGADELVRLPDLQDANSPALEFPVTVQNFPPDRRQALITNVAKFSSTDAASHLISFGEFCAMYLCAWSPAVWPAILQDKDILDPPDAVPMTADYLKAPNGRSELLDAEERKRLFVDQSASLWEFRARLPAVRRALANVPVFMIFDDHEISDDWNLSRAWRDTAIGNPLGRAILRNGLAAYVLFQAWGNDPQSFATNSQHVLSEIAAFFPAAAVAGPDNVKVAQFESSLGFGAMPTLTFNYIVESAVHRVMVLDTRTMRGYDSDEGPAALIEGGAMGFQFHSSDVPPLAPRPVTIVVSPAPAFGLAVLEEWVQPPGAIFVGRLGADMEAWSFHVWAFEQLLQVLNSLGRVVVLSGDVHYSFSTWLTYWRGAEPPRPARRFAQLTSSALKNEASPGEKAVIGLAGVIGLEIAKVGWLPPRPVLTMAVPSQWPPYFPLRWKEGPVVPTVGWPVLSPHRAHDWSWRLSIARDIRGDFDGTADTRPAASSEPPLSALLVAAATIDAAIAYTAYSAGAAYVADSTINAAHRTVVTGSSIGKVEFTSPAGTLRVKHSILSPRPDAADPDRPEPHVVHDILIAPITEADEAEPVFP